MVLVKHDDASAAVASVVLAYASEVGAKAPEEMAVHLDPVSEMTNAIPRSDISDRLGF